MWTLKPLVWAVVCLGLLGLLSCFSTPKPINPTQQPIQPAKDALEQWIDKLATYEQCPAEGIIDFNHQKSYSCLCFQMPTFKQYFSKYYPEAAKQMEQSDWLNQISDCQLQKELAYRMIQDNYANWKHWAYSITVRKLEKPPKASPEWP